MQFEIITDAELQIKHVDYLVEKSNHQFFQFIIITAMQLRVIRLVSD